MKSMTEEDILEHYGVKGMHWGVRRDREDLTSLSEDDLRKRVDRMRLEKQYRELSVTPSSSAGVRFIVKHADKTVSALIGMATTYVGQRALRQMFEK